VECIQTAGYLYSEKTERRLTMTSKYFEATCAKCDWQLVIPVYDKNDEDYYLCQTCAFAKMGV
jgi:hypothetical protein